MKNKRKKASGSSERRISKKHGNVKKTTNSNKKGRSTGRQVLLEAKFIMSPSGHSFAAPTAGENDFFIPPRMTGGALNGDIVEIRKILPGERAYGKGNEAEVTKIIERKNQTVTGELISLYGKLYVRPDNERIPYLILIKDCLVKISVGDKAVAEITAYPGDRDNNKKSRGGRTRQIRDRAEKACLEGYVIRSLGNAESREANYEAVLLENGITIPHSEQAITEAEISAAQTLSMKGRKDCRDEIIFTIDGEDAKDLDDAVSLRRLEDGWCLSVFIADVSHYVKEGGAVDNDALERGTSVYFVDKVVPMLPESLSNGACSLNSGEDKYALAARIYLDKNGRRTKMQFEKAVMRSAVRGVYSEVNDIFENKEKSRFADKYSTVLPMLFNMYELYKILQKNGKDRGAMELDSPEADIKLDNTGFPVEISERTRGDAERLIEQFMLAANEAAASFLLEHSMPALYRIHEDPDPEKMRTFLIFAHNAGIDISPAGKVTGDGNIIPKKGISPLALSMILDDAEKKGIIRTVSGVLLRSLMKAKYSITPKGHFGLASPLYCHFTSPIRRYPDLVVHRGISAIISGTEPLKDRAVKEAETMSNDGEMRAVTAERRIDDLYMALYMTRHIGEEFDGTVSSVTPFGIFVRLENLIEGLVPLSSIGNMTSEYSEETISLRVHTADGIQIFRLGDKVRVKAVSADIVKGKITFELL